MGCLLDRVWRSNNIATVLIIMENKAEEKMLLEAAAKLEKVIRDEDQGYVPPIEDLILIGHLVDYMIGRLKIGS